MEMYLNFYNVSFETVQWLVSKNKLVSISRSSVVKLPNKINGTSFVSNFYDLKELCVETGEFYNCDEISNCLNGYDVKTIYFDFNSDTPEELLEHVELTNQ